MAIPHILLVRNKNLTFYRQLRGVPQLRLRSEDLTRAHREPKQARVTRRQARRQQCGHGKRRGAPSRQEVETAQPSARQPLSLKQTHSETTSAAVALTRKRAKRHALQKREVRPAPQPTTHEHTRREATWMPPNPTAKRRGGGQTARNKSSLRQSQRGRRPGGPGPTGNGRP